MATLLADVLEDVEGEPQENGELSILGLDLGDYEHDVLIHQKIVALLRTYVDRQRALELYASLNGEAQTHLEDAIGDKLLNPKEQKHATLDEVRTLAFQHETREEVYVKNTAKRL